MTLFSADPAQDDRAPGPYHVWDISVEFVADRGGDAAGRQNVRLRWDSVPPESRESELLVELWQLWHARSMEQAKAESAPIDVFALAAKRDEGNAIG